MRRFLLACLRLACLARLFGLVCTSACKMAWRASRGTDPRPGEGERVLSGLLPRARVPQTVTNRISGSAAPRRAWPTSGLVASKKKKMSSCATRITHAGPPPPPTDLAVTPPHQNSDSDLFKNIFHSRRIEYCQSGAWPRRVRCPLPLTDAPDQTHCTPVPTHSDI